MILKSFRIRNYKSLEDTGDCYLSNDGTTILAGKNEAGKTAILEALEDFNIKNSIREDAKPLHNNNLIPRIELTFNISKKTLNQIFDELNLKNRNREYSWITIAKQYPDSYYIISQSDNIPDIEEVDDTEKLLQEMQDYIDVTDQLHKKYPQINADLPDVESRDDLSNFANHLDQYTSNVNQVQNFLSSDDLNLMRDVLSNLANIYNQINNGVQNKASFLDRLKEHIPNFILFSSFDDEFPSEIPLEEALKHEFIKDLIEIADLDIDIIQNGTQTQVLTHREKVNIELKEDYSKFWTQDLTQIYTSSDNQKIYFSIKEDGNYFPPRMRSKGKQWHLAFYIRISARAKDNIPNVILIDEPGLYLHAKAQKDILRKLVEDSSKEHPILFTTHSPYLFENDKLHRVRLITKTTKSGTKISNKIHKGADTETLTPIITAIGLDLSLGLDIAKNNNIICEGITDYYYVCAMKQLLDINFVEPIHIIPCASASKSMTMTSLMIGWELNYCNLLDNDTEGKKTKKTLIKSFGEETTRIIMVSENQDEEIEDLFDKKDFAKYVLRDEEIEVPASTANSKYIKNKSSKFDKVLLSKLFYEDVINGEVDLSDTTKDNFKALLERLNNKLFES